MALLNPCRMWIENYLSALVRPAAAAGDRRRDCAGLAPEVRAHSDGRIAGPGPAATIIPCRPELRREDLERATPPRPPRTAVAAAETDQGSSAHASPNFIFDDFDQLSDKQIKNIVENHDQNQQAAILLAPADF